MALNACGPCALLQWFLARGPLPSDRAIARAARPRPAPPHGSGCAGGSLRLIQAAGEASRARILSSASGLRGILRLVTKGAKQRNDYLAAARSSPDLVSFVRLGERAIKRVGAADEAADAKVEACLDEGAGAGAVPSVDGMANGVGNDIEEALLVRDGVALSGTRYTQVCGPLFRMPACRARHRSFARVPLRRWSLLLAA